MNKFDLGAITISAIIALIAFFTINNIFACIGVLLLFVAYYFLIARKKVSKYIEQNNRIHLCCNFINSFLISLSIKNSMDDAFEAATRNPHKSFKLVLDEINNMPARDKLDYLKKYFEFSIYKMLMDLLSLYDEQGGNILKMGESLLAETRRIEESLIENNSNCRKKLIEFIVLWCLSFAVLLFMRFALNNFYANMLASKIFVILLIVFYLVVLLSVHIFTFKITILPINEESIKYE